MSGLDEFWQACDREGVQLCTVSREPGGMFRLHAVKLAGEEAVDRFWNEAATHRTYVLQPLLPDEEHRLCAAIHPVGGQCMNAATHVVVETRPGDTYHEVSCCPAHLAEAISVVLYGPAAGAQRPVWN